MKLLFLKTGSLAAALSLCFVCMVHPSSAQTSPSPDAFAQLQNAQRIFIAIFSGTEEYSEGKFLRTRSRHAERIAAGGILITQMKQLGLTATRQKYRMPNMHFTLDLIGPPVRGANIVTHLPATNGSDVHIIVGAHYDSVPGSPGANDNATGVAIVLAVAKALSKLEVRHYNFSIVFFDQEEDGSFGSKAYAAQLVRGGVKVHSVHNADLVGWDGDGDRVIELDLPTPELEALYQQSADRLGLTISKVRYNSSDHIAFREQGFDAMCMSEEWAGGDATPHHHKRTDAIEYVDFEYLALSTQLMVGALTQLAATP